MVKLQGVMNVHRQARDHAMGMDGVVLDGRGTVNMDGNRQKS